MFGTPITFAAPWILGFLAALPLLWWLLRLTPPAPRKVIFPALSLLQGLATSERTPARTPWWLLLLRFVIAALIILAFAEPLLNPQAPLPGVGSVLIAVDNDWAAARAWDARQEALHNLIDEAEREGRDVLILPTAPLANGMPLQIFGPVAAKAAYSYADQLTPVPWRADWKTAKTLLEKTDRSGVAYSVWLNSGLGGGDAAAFFEALKTAGALRPVRLLSDTENPIYLLTLPKSEDDSGSFSITRANVDAAATTSVAALDAQGNVLTHIPVEFSAGSPRAAAKLDVPLDVYNQAARLEVESQHTAGTTALLDEDWQRRPVGIVGDKAEEAEHSLLSGLFYVDRALKPFADIHIDGLDKLLDQNMAVLVLTDSAPLNDKDIPHLLDWIKKGGVLVRFAGERIAAEQSPKEAELLPVVLRTGDRAMGGTMSWATPQKLHEFPAASPFHGLTIPPDVSINRQILAEPAEDLAQKTWANLEDGTPLVTAKPIGRGLSIFFHVPAKSEWSNLPLSGLFVDMLRRIVDLSHAVNKSSVDFSSLAPQQTLDAFGTLQAPPPAVRPVTDADFSHVEVGPQHPPGIYGSDSMNRAFNLGFALPPPESLRDLPIQNYHMEHQETKLQPVLLAVAFGLLLFDFLLSLFMRGVVPAGLFRTGKLSLLFFLIFALHTAQAADDNKLAVELTAKTFLAYVKTGNHESDHISEAGLQGLARVLQRRTSLNDIGVAGVDPERDELVFFPLLYWPLNQAAQPLSPQAAQRVNNYLHHGGMILFDGGGDGGQLSVAIMQHLLAGVNIPPLVHIPENHVLHRSFYLLDEFPGRNAGDDLWLEPEEMSSYDGVASVIAGSGGWAGAWAVDEQGRPMFACTPGGEAQRERAYRFGVNIVMYALTGNYKSDQLHAQVLLQRLGK